MIEFFARTKATIFLSLITILLAGSALGQTIDDCLDCHGDSGLVAEDSLGHERSLFVNLATFKSSVHGEFTCVDCHTGISELPHAEKLPKADCVSFLS